MDHLRIGIIMAGGSGERFWPLSTPERPKQLLNICENNHSLLQETYSRLTHFIQPDNIFVATATHLKEATSEQLPNMSQENILSEPMKRNTAGCLLWVLAHLKAKYPNSWEKISVSIVPADHYIEPKEQFSQLVTEILNFCEKNTSLVTIGITPTRPETGYGYIEIDPDQDIQGSIGQVKSFREKPSLDRALQYFSSGQHFWNSGMFFWTLESFYNKFKEVSPDLIEYTDQMAEYIAEENHQKAADTFALLPNISIDYALMEKAEDVYFAKANFNWDDIGAWDAISRLHEQDSELNTIHGDHVVMNSKNCTVYSENNQVNACLLGVEDLIVVTAGDKVLVAHKDKAQEVRKLAQLASNKLEKI